MDTKYKWFKVWLITSDDDALRTLNILSDAGVIPEYIKVSNSSFGGWDIFYYNDKYIPTLKSELKHL